MQLRGVDPWAKDVMPLIPFKQIRGPFHPESKASLSGDKCHQLRYFIRRFNKNARKVFNLGAMASFDEGGVPMQSRYCPVQQYNKDKPDKYTVDFFIAVFLFYCFLFPRIWHTMVYNFFDVIIRKGCN